MQVIAAVIRKESWITTSQKLWAFSQNPVLSAVISL